MFQVAKSRFRLQKTQLHQNGVGGCGKYAHEVLTWIKFNSHQQATGLQTCWLQLPSMTRCIFCVETCLEWHARIPSLIHPHSLRIHARRGRMHSYSVRTCWAAMLRPTARSLSSSRTCLGSKSRSLAKQILVFGFFQRPTPCWRKTLLVCQPNLGKYMENTISFVPEGIPVQV